MLQATDFREQAAPQALLAGGQIRRDFAGAEARFAAACGIITLLFSAQRDGGVLDASG
jgi:hypothetical protein